jgi:hypothetical protein
MHLLADPGRADDCDYHLGNRLVKYGQLVEDRRLAR